MNSEYLWRYLSYDKYEKLLRTGSIYFPKASRLSDRDEGQWVAYVVLNRDDENRIKPLPEYISTIDQLLLEAGSNGQKIQQKCLFLLASIGDDQDLLNSILCQAVLAPLGKIEAILQSRIEGWTKAIAIQEERKERWIGQNSIHRESTYISCWCESSKLSMQMWDLFCGNKSGVAIRIKKGNLQQLLDRNKEKLTSLSLKNTIAKVKYFSNLRKPTDETLDLVFDLMKKVHNSDIVQFLVKSDIYSVENEVRAILYHHRGTRDPIVDPYPESNGFNLEMHPRLSKQEALFSFIDKVYVHPLLSEDDPITQRIRELHRSYDLCGLSLEVQNEIAFGE